MGRFCPNAIFQTNACDLLSGFTDEDALDFMLKFAHNLGISDGRIYFNTHEYDGQILVYFRQAFWGGTALGMFDKLAHQAGGVLSFPLAALSDYNSNRGKELMIEQTGTGEVQYFFSEASLSGFNSRIVADRLVYFWEIDDYTVSSSLVSYSRVAF